MVIEYLAALNNSIDLAKRLKEISKNIKDAEFKQVLADLYNELGDVKIQMASLKEQIAELKEENHALKIAKPENKEKPTLVDQWYEFEGDDGRFCTGCYDSQGKKIRVTEFIANVYACPVCNNSFET